MLKPVPRRTQPARHDSNLMIFMNRPHGGGGAADTIGAT
jgi:hypothetical protein